MSADNYIIIDRNTFEVRMGNASTGCTLVKIGKGKTLDEAIDLAQEYMETEIVEYGICFTKKKKKNGRK